MFYDLYFQMKSGKIKYLNSHSYTKIILAIEGHEDVSYGISVEMRQKSSVEGALHWESIAELENSCLNIPWGLCFPRFVLRGSE